MPAIARPRATPAQPSPDRGTELEPNRVLDDRGRETMAAVAKQGHADILADQPLSPDPVSVTMRFTRLARKFLLVR